MRALLASWILIALGGCSSTPMTPLERWGLQCQDSTDPDYRMARVRALVNSGDERAIPILIDCLESYKNDGKRPDRNYQTTSWVPNVSVSPELWGVWILTRQDFDLKIVKWRAWYAFNKGKLEWDGGERRFVPKK